MNKKKFHLIILSSVVIALGIVSSYLVEVKHYDNVTNSEQVNLWLQTTLYSQQVALNKSKSRSRDIFNRGGDKAKIAKRKSKRKKTKKKLTKSTPIIKPVLSMVSRLRCLAVAKRDKQWTAYVTLNEQVHLVRIGDVINKQIRILNISENGVRVEDVKEGRRSLVSVLGV